MTITDLARICHFAQDHLSDFKPEDFNDIKNDIPITHVMLEPTSYVIACFLAQETNEGHWGVGWDIVHNELCGQILSVSDWETIIQKLVNEHGGFHDKPMTEDELGGMKA
jgi:hypothetical protein